MTRYFVSALLALQVACTCTPQCRPGEAACACLAANQCNDGLVCGGDGTCAAPTLAGVVVSDPAARGCEVLLTEAAGTVITAGQFSGGVVGTSLREAPRVALTFVAPGDAPFPAGGVSLALAQGTTAGVTVTKASCVDAKGARLQATVTIR